MSAQTMLWGWKLVGHTPAAKLLAIWIGDCCDVDGNARVSVDRACEWAGLSESQFGAAVAELSVSGLTAGPEEAGYVMFQLPVKAAPLVTTTYRRPDESGHLYVIAAGGKTKIGISRDIEGRLLWLQSGNPNPITVALKLASPSIRRMRAIEGEAHRRLADKRVSGEWFDVSPERAVEVVRAVDAEIPNPLASK